MKIHAVRACFLEESVRSLVETGALAGERGAYRLVKAPEALQIPATVQTILAARIDRLSPDDKRLLQTASAIGKDVPVAPLQAIAEIDETAVGAGLTRLQAAEFLYEVQLFPEAEGGPPHRTGKRQEPQEHLAAANRRCTARWT